MKTLLLLLVMVAWVGAQTQQYPGGGGGTTVTGGSSPNQVLTILATESTGPLVYTTPVADKDSVVFGPCKDTSGLTYSFSIDAWSTTGATLSILPAVAPTGGVKCGVNTGGGAAVAGAYDATDWNGDTNAPTKDAVRDKIEALVVGGGHTQNTDTHTDATCFQINEDANGPKVCDDGSGGYQIKTDADAVLMTVDATGVLTLGDGTAPWNLTGLTDDAAPSAPGSANEFTAYVDRTTGLWSYILNGGTVKHPALGKWVTFTGPTAARSYALPDADGNIALESYVGTAVGTARTRMCELHIWGTGASSVLQDTDDEAVSCFNGFGVTETITAVRCYANAGSPTVTPIVTGGAADSILTGALTCGTGSFASGTLNGTPTLSSTGTIDANVTAAGGVATNIRLVLTLTR
jgi:hypothetical protein